MLNQSSSQQATSGEQQLRITRSQSNMDNVQEVNSSIQSTTQIFDSLQTKTIKSKETTSVNTQLLSDILNELRLLRKEVNESKKENHCTCQCQKTVSNNEEPKTTNDPSVTRIIENHSKLWKETLQKRKFAFYNHLKNEQKAAIYEDYLTKTPPFIPDVCKEKDIPGQSSEEWVKLKNEREIANIVHNVEKMRAFANQHKKNIEDLDTSIATNFNHQNEEVKNKIMDLWKAEVQVEENVSKDIWKKKKEFLSSLPEKKDKESSRENGNEAPSVTNTWTLVERKKPPRNRNRKSPRGNEVRVGVETTSESVPQTRTSPRNWGQNNYKPQNRGPNSTINYRGLQNRSIQNRIPNKPKNDNSQNFRSNTHWRALP